MAEIEESRVRTRGSGRIIRVGGYELPQKMSAWAQHKGMDVVADFAVTGDHNVVCERVEFKGADIKRRSLTDLSIDDLKEQAINDQARRLDGSRAAREAARAVHRARKPVPQEVLKRVAEILAENPKGPDDNERALASSEAYHTIISELEVSPRTAQRYVRDVVEMSVEPEPTEQTFVLRGYPMTFSEADEWLERRMGRRPE